MELMDVEQIAYKALEMMGCGHYIVHVSHMKIIITDPNSRDSTWFMYSTSRLDRYVLIGAVADSAYKLKNRDTMPDAGDGNELHEEMRDVFTCSICGRPKTHHRLYGYRCDNPEHNE